MREHAPGRRELLREGNDRPSGFTKRAVLVYSTTLLPGEKVRIRTSDRHTRYSFDSETSLAYRHEATSEESFFMAGMASAVSDVTSVESSVATSVFNESSFSAGGGASLDLVFFEIGGGASGSSYSASSLDTFARSASRHAESSSRHIELGVRTASSTSVGEVDRRTHTESESESHFESYSREFANPNRCHAVTSSRRSTSPRRRPSSSSPSSAGSRMPRLPPGWGSGRASPRPGSRCSPRRSTAAARRVRRKRKTRRAARFSRVGRASPLPVTVEALCSLWE